ncbi:NAD(P)-dependent oxidoreductase [Mesorhizobium sp. WSM3868]|uniref:NAD(P)-dependent oxidoreductase n=1 Tax=Mesorhizobium sp. WSM3868 TaxID=2029405 RepID=UPI000BAFEEAE|nr:NAD(P)-dependent oxidoreductase [Mesorhizobium sp. WSM3868]PBB30524.1 phosphoglycerate dehydrogenase [Mesorhizobium sp. WSM3868]
MKVLCRWHTTDEELQHIKAAMPSGTEVVVPEGEYFSRFECTYSGIERHAADVFLAWTIPEGIPEIAKNLKMLSWLHSGIDDLGEIGFLTHAKQYGIKVANIRGANAIAVAEQSMMFVLALAKQTIAKNEASRERYKSFPLFAQETRSAMLSGQTIGVIGVGNIGSRVAKRAKAFDMRVLGVRRNRDRHDEYVDSMHGIEELHAVLAQCDYVVLATPHTGHTFQLLGEAELAVMKPSAFLVNCARGQLIDERSLHTALTTERLRGYAADVWPYYAWPGAGFVQ